MKAHHLQLMTSSNNIPIFFSVHTTLHNHNIYFFFINMYKKAFFFSLNYNKSFHSESAKAKFSAPYFSFAC